MSKIILLLFIIQTSFQLAEAQWISQFPNTPGVAFHDVKFINRNTGWACGDGIIVKTTNSGLNWIVQSHPAAGKFLYSISPVDSMTIYCVGYFETILKTTNGGDSWIALRNGPSGLGHSYQGTFFINENTGWVCGSGSTIMKTTNGGNLFDSTFLTWGYLKDLYFKDANTGLMSAEFGGIFKTTNGGLDWKQKFITHIGGGIGDFRKLSILNNQYVFVVEDVGRVFKSTNFGETWDSIGYVAGADQPYVCRFSSLSTGWVGGTFGQLFKSTDSGATWRRENTGNDQRYFGAMWFYNDSIGWGVGGNTKILYTTTSGLTNLNAISNIFPEDFKLYQNYPNPFNPETKIKFEISKASYIQIKAYDNIGREISILVNEKLEAGVYETVFNGNNFTSGVYFYSFYINGLLIETKKLLLIK